MIQRYQELTTFRLDFYKNVERVEKVKRVEGV